MSLTWPESDRQLRDTYRREVVGDMEGRVIRSE